MRPTRAFALLAALAAPLVHSAAIDSELVVRNNDGAKTTASWSYKNCGTSADLVDLKYLKISPDPPVPGEDLTVTAAGFVKDTIEWGAYADVTVKLGLIKLLQKEFDICEEAQKNNATIQCPVESDDYVIVQTVALPKEIPKAKFVVQVRAYSVDEDNLLCLDLFIDFMKPFLKGFGF